MPSLPDTFLQVHQIATWKRDKSGLLIGLGVAFSVLGNVGVALRLLGQWRISRRFFIDDALLVFALLCADAFTGLFLAITRADWALHPDETAAAQLIAYSRMFLKVFFATTIVNGPLLTSIRLSLLHLYRRLLILNERWIRRMWWTVYIYNLAWGIGTTIYYIFHCRPVDWFWNRISAVPDANGHFAGVCDPQPAVSIPLIFSIPADIGTLLIPVIVVSRMRISKRRKFALSVLFSLGLIACGCEITRIILEWPEHTSINALYALTNFAIISMAEFHLAIFCACLPLCMTLYRAARAYFSRRFELLASNTKRTSHNIGGSVGGYDRDLGRSSQDRDQAVSYTNEHDSQRWSDDTSTQLDDWRDKSDVESGTLTNGG